MTARRSPSNGTASAAGSPRPPAPAGSRPAGKRPQSRRRPKGPGASPDLADPRLGELLEKVDVLAARQAELSALLAQLSEQLPRIEQRLGASVGDVEDVLANRVLTSDQQP